MSEDEYMEGGEGNQDVYVDENDITTDVTETTTKKKIKLPKIDLKKGILGDRSVGVGKIKFKLNEIAFPMIQPKFDQKVKETGDSFALYMNVIDFLHGFVMMISHFIVYCFFVFCSLGFIDQLPIVMYEYFSWIAVFLYPLVYLLVALPKYFILYSACRQKDEKRKMIFFVIYFVLSAVLCVFYLYLSIGGPGAIGLWQTIEVGIIMNKPTPHFVKIWLFLTCLGMTLVFLTQIVLNFIVMICVVIRIIKIKKGGVTTKGNAQITDNITDIPQENEGEWGGVDFNQDDDGDEYL